MTAPADTSAPTLDVAIAKAASFLRERLRSGAYGLAAVGSDGTPIIDSQNADGSWGLNGDPYETALAVAALAGHQPHTAATQRGVEYLLSMSAVDGSWASGACVWESHWNEHDIWRGYDTHRAFTTARCLIALRRAGGQLASP
jgi:hypothetical protein